MGGRHYTLKVPRSSFRLRHSSFRVRHSSVGSPQLRRVQCSSEGCCLAQRVQRSSQGAAQLRQSAAQLRRVQHSSEGVAQLLGCSEAQIECSIAHLNAATVAQQGTAKLTRGQRSSRGYSVAQQGAAQPMQWKNICPWRPEFGPEGRHFVSGNSFIFILGSEAAMGGGAQRPFGRGKEPKKTGARSARARTRGQNPLVYYIFIQGPLSVIFLSVILSSCHPVIVAER